MATLSSGSRTSQRTRVYISGRQVAKAWSDAFSGIEIENALRIDRHVLGTDGFLRLQLRKDAPPDFNPSLIVQCLREFTTSTACHHRNARTDVVFNDQRRHPSDSRTLLIARLAYNGSSCSKRWIVVFQKPKHMSVCRVMSRATLYARRLILYPATDDGDNREVG